VPTAISDLSAAAAQAVISKPLAVAMLDRAESVQRLRRLPVAQPPAGRPAETRPAGGLTVVDAAAADEETAAILDEAAAAVTGVPAYADAGSAARALGHAARYQAWRSRQRGEIPELSGVRTADARALVAGFLAGSPAGGWMPEAKAAELVSCYGVPLAVTMSAASEQEAVEAAAKLGGRVVLKAE